MKTSKQLEAIAEKVYTRYMAGKVEKEIWKEAVWDAQLAQEREDREIAKSVYIDPQITLPNGQPYIPFAKV